MRSVIFAEAPTLRVGPLILVLVWASCRFYYVLFYVLERYVDGSLRYAGLFALVRELVRGKA